MHPPNPKRSTGGVDEGQVAGAEKASSRGDTLEDVLAPENMAQAWKQVRANKGVAGVDGMEIGDFPDFVRKHWDTIRGKRVGGTYKPSPVRRVSIPKEQQWVSIRYPGGPRGTSANR